MDQTKKVFAVCENCKKLISLKNCEDHTKKTSHKEFRIIVKDLVQGVEQ